MPTLNYAAIRSSVSIQQVLDLLQFHAYRRLGDELRGPCPIHGSESPRSRSFAVNLAKNAFCCFSCGARGNQLDLWAAARQLPLYEATLDLCRRLGQEVPVLAHPGPKPAKPDHRLHPKPAKPDHRESQRSSTTNR